MFLLCVGSRKYENQTKTDFWQKSTNLGASFIRKGMFRHAVTTHVYVTLRLTPYWGPPRGPSCYYYSCVTVKLTPWGTPQGTILLLLLLYKF